MQKLIFSSTIELNFHQITVNRLKPYLKFCRQPSKLEKKGTVYQSYCPIETLLWSIELEVPQKNS